MHSKKLKTIYGWIAIATLAVTVQLGVTSCGPRGLRTRSARPDEPVAGGGRGQCVKGEIWNKTLQRCLVYSCARGKYLDRGECLDECPAGTIGWQPSRRSRLKRGGGWICNSALELRDRIRLTEMSMDKVSRMKTTRAVRRRVTEIFASRIQRAKSALGRLAEQGDRSASRSPSNDRPGECYSGEIWNKYYRRCFVTKCPANTYRNRGECVDECPARTAGWQPSVSKGLQCNTALELRDLLTYSKRAGRKLYTSRAQRVATTQRAREALATLQSGTRSTSSRHGRTNTSNDGPPPPGNDGPPPPRDGPPPPSDSGPPPPRDNGPPPPGDGPPPPRTSPPAGVK